MTGLTLLIIGAPVALWRLVARFGKHRPESVVVEGSRSEDWAWPRYRARRASHVGVR